MEKDTVFPHQTFKKVISETFKEEHLILLHNDIKGCRLLNVFPAMHFTEESAKH